MTEACGRGAFHWDGKICFTFFFSKKKKMLVVTCAYAYMYVFRQVGFTIKYTEYNPRHMDRQKTQARSNETKSAK